MSIEGLPTTFTYRYAREAGVSKRRLYQLRDDGVIQQVARGVYRRADAPPADLDLIDIAQRAPEATLCLISALAEHQLTDAIPAFYDLAMPRGVRPPATEAQVHWHAFDPRTFAIGRDGKALDDTARIGLYSAERSIVDAFRLRAQIGEDVAYEALRRWLRHGGQPSSLLKVAQAFPHARGEIRRVLAVLA
jgi:predicted transcriptional regulator of viral defense system